MTRTKTAAQKTHLSYAQELQSVIDADMPDTVPDAWHDIWREKDRRDAKRLRCTLSLDADVVRFFKAMGAGYQPRINRVLRAFMHYRLAGVLDGPEVTDADRRAEVARLKAEIAAGLRGLAEG